MYCLGQIRTYSRSCNYSEGDSKNMLASTLKKRRLHTYKQQTSFQISIARISLYHLYHSSLGFFQIQNDINIKLLAKLRCLSLSYTNAYTPTTVITISCLRYDALVTLR